MKSEMHCTDLERPLEKFDGIHRTVGYYCHCTGCEVKEFKE